MEVFRWVLKALQQSMIRHKHDDCAVEGWDELCEKVGDVVVEMVAARLALAMDVVQQCQRESRSASIAVVSKEVVRIIQPS